MSHGDDKGELIRSVQLYRIEVSRAKSQHFVKCTTQSPNVGGGVVWLALSQVSVLRSKILVLLPAQET